MPELDLVFTNPVCSLSMVSLVMNCGHAENAATPALLTGAVLGWGQGPHTPLPLSGCLPSFVGFFVTDSSVEWSGEMKGPGPFKFGAGLKQLMAVEIFAPILSKLLSIAVICTN